MIIVHHLDADGRASAAIAHYFGAEGPFYEVDYRDEFPVDKIPPGSEVAILDFSPENEAVKTWLWLVNNCKKIIWVDHHKSSIKIFNQFRDLYPALAKKVDDFFSEARSGAYLSWKYWGYNSMQKMPRAIMMIDLFDRWKHDDDKEILDFIAGLDTFDYGPTADIWPMLFSQDAESVIAKICKNGAIVRKYKEQQAKETLKRIGYETEFDGHKAIVINATDKGSKTFDSVKDKYPLYMVWNFDGRKYEVSLYRREGETFDVADMCQKRGGGGHVGTGGFVVDKLPEELKGGKS